MTKIFYPGSGKLRIPQARDPRIAAMIFRMVLVAIAGLGATLPNALGQSHSPHGAIKMACVNCHTITSWKPIRPFLEFDHRSTRFPLQGMHANLDCRQCHVRLVFSSIGTACADCHADIHRRQFGSDCEQCHSVRGWREVVQNANRHENRFPLLGVHATVGCESCHKSAAVGVYRGLSADCASCHSSDFHNAKSVNHQAAGFSTQCETCHRFDRWAQGFDHAKVTGFALAGAHTRLECAQCHSGSKFAGTPADCAGCHLQDYSGATNPNHAQAVFPKDCSMCHSVTAWQGATFNHNNTRFALTGAHTGQQCPACHSTGQYAGLPTACVSCHQQVFAGTTNPNHIAAGFPQDCTVCHGTTAWTTAIFDHSKTQFPLTGAHAGQQCSACHAGGQYATLPTACISCHLAGFNSASNPNHVAAGFPQNCTLCHNATAWTPALFDHSRTQFPLAGAHAGQQCSACHANGQYATLPTACVSCHLVRFNGTTNPNHVAAGFPQDCTLCHNTAAWTPALFDHSKTPFPLTGAHAGQQCSACHANGQYATLPTACVSCHLVRFNGTTNPNHVVAGFPQDCTLCHNTAAWTPALFDHSKTPFPLTGAHAGQQCSACHSSGQYASLPTTCVSCHLARFNSTTNPNHVAAGFPQDCTTCHNTAAWTPALFDHSKTQFPLTGAHVGQQCSACHSSGRYAGLPTACVSCHLVLFNSTTNPNHVTGGFPQDCTLCHNTAAWTPSLFDHSKTRFPLTGAHATQQCSTCHSSGQYATLPTTCVSCHLARFNSTTNPNHVAAGFPQDCTLCHNTTAWTPALFDHSKTQFPLTGAHIGQQCSACHSSGQYAGLPTACVSCHLANFNGTTNPNHVSSGFPQDCFICHNTAAWIPSIFDHSKTQFPLTGAHTTVACANCHISGVYAGTPTDCYSCHSKEYNSVTDPNHVAAAFPKVCSQCHSTSSWSGAVFNHTKFPIYSGTHAGRWTTCSDCHTNSNDYSVFSCITCHAHDKTTTDSHHQGISNYIYSSTSCYSCHPTGRAG